MIKDKWDFVAIKATMQRWYEAGKLSEWQFNQMDSWLDDCYPQYVNAGE